MEHEFIQTSNEHLQYLSDLREFAVQNLETLVRQGESIKKNLGNVVLYTVSKRYSESSMEANKDVTEV
ncbi:MAG: hypothetical protein LUD40_09420, partial [Phocaeicola dorei]|nr:hypothetical protein [Phocaeicola dorei]